LDRFKLETIDNVDVFHACRFGGIDWGTLPLVRGHGHGTVIVWVTMMHVHDFGWMCKQLQNEKDSKKG